MPMPIAKVVMSLMRTFAWPIISVVSRRIKQKQRPREEQFYYWFGLKCFAFEARIERMILQNNILMGIEDGLKHDSYKDLAKIGR